MFPTLGERDMKELTADIKRNGVRVPIQLAADGTILDGYHRYLAAVMAGIDPPVVEWSGDDDDSEYIKFAVSANLHRRHLSADQRAQIGLDSQEYLKLARGKQRHKKKSTNRIDCGSCETPIANEDIARSVEVAPRTVELGVQVRRECEPEVVAEVKAGKKSAVKAIREAREQVHRDNPDAQTDHYGNILPVHVAASFDDAAAIRKIRARLHELKREVEQYCKDSRACVDWIELQYFNAGIQQCAAALRFAEPYCLCPVCAGDRCKVCRQTGWLPKEYYDAPGAVEKSLKYENRKTA